MTQDKGVDASLSQRSSLQGIMTYAIILRENDPAILTGGRKPDVVFLVLSEPIIMEHDA